MFHVSFVLVFTVCSAYWRVGFIVLVFMKSKTMEAQLWELKFKCNLDSTHLFSQVMSASQCSQLRSLWMLNVETDCFVWCSAIHTNETNPTSDPPKKIMLKRGKPPRWLKILPVEKSSLGSLGSLGRLGPLPNFRKCSFSCACIFVKSVLAFTTGTCRCWGRLHWMQECKNFAPASPITKRAYIHTNLIFQAWGLWGINRSN